jgi:hypothetical protein
MMMLMKMKKMKMKMKMMMKNIKKIMNVKNVELHVVEN